MKKANELNVSAELAWSVGHFAPSRDERSAADIAAVWLGDGARTRESVKQSLFGVR